MGEAKEKLLYIELLRWISALSVILLHVISESFINSAIYGTRSWIAVNIINSFCRFGVPVFFMISGFLLLGRGLDEGPWAFWRKRLSRLVLPLLFWSAAYFVAEKISLKEQITLGTLSEFLFDFVGMQTEYHLWFLYTMIILCLLIPVLRPFFKDAPLSRIWYFLVTITLFTTVFPLINTLSGMWIFRFESPIIGYMGFMALGCILGRAPLTNKLRAIVYSAGVLGGAAGALGTWLLSSETQIDTFFNGGYQLPAYLTAAAVFILTRDLCRLSFVRRLAPVITVHGKLAFGVYLIHVFVLDLVVTINPFESFVPNIIFTFFAASAISFAVVWLLRKIKPLRKLL